jgi:hypothetical protein
VEHEEQLSWEARVGRPVAIAAFAAAIFLIAAIVYSTSTIKEATQDSVDQALVLSAHKTDFLVSSFFQALSQALFAPPLWLLYKVTKYRRPQTPPIARWLAIIGPVAAGVVFMINRIQLTSAFDKIVKHLSEVGMPPKAANDYVKDQLTTGNLQAIGGLGFAAGLIMALALVLICINAMRAGVLSRFMGIIGIIVGVLLVLPIFGNVPFVQVFWVAALGLLFLGRWPQGGRGPAWDAGEAIPWPTAQDRAAATAEARAEREAARDDDDYEPARETVPPDIDDDHPVAREHPRSKKRKRKRR